MRAGSAPGISDAVMCRIRAGYRCVVRAGSAPGDSDAVMCLYRIRAGDEYGVMCRCVTLCVP